ncbi:hypothetical protein SSTU70S_05088 [Stutzerimonas stutzeri]
MVSDNLWPALLVNFALFSASLRQSFNQSLHVLGYGNNARQQGNTVQRRIHCACPAHKTFDPFRVMGVSTKELLHSRVLAAFLDAHQPHGLGSRFRDDYLASLVNCRRVGAAQPVAVDVLQNTSGAKAKVLRELAKIDVLWIFPICPRCVAIENKIRALDQPKQVARYQLSLCDLFPHYEHRAIVYLTPSGRDSPTANLACTRVPIYYQSYKWWPTLLGVVSHRPTHLPGSSLTNLYAISTER